MAVVPSNDTDWKQMPAVYTDVFDVAVIPDIKMVRMAFSEHVAGVKPGYVVRTAIMMPVSDAKELVKILGKLIADSESKEDKPKTTLNKL
jgi:hypothetical protein